AIAHAVNEACDAADGVKDGVLNDPRKCHFTPATLLCKEGDSDSCLTQPQVTALEKLYQGARDSKGRQVFPGFMPGGEEGGGGWLIIYHGWNDAAISALNSIDYYETVRKTMGPAQTDSFLRLYMVPGMQHCGGGPGTDTFGQFGFSPQNDPQHNMYVALEQWV